MLWPRHAARIFMYSTSKAAGRGGWPLDPLRKWAGEPTSQYMAKHNNKRRARKTTREIKANQMGKWKPSKAMPIQVECISISNKNRTLIPNSPTAQQPSRSLRLKLSETVDIWQSTVAIIICHIINSSVHKKRWQWQWLGEIPSGQGQDQSGQRLY